MQKELDIILFASPADWEAWLEIHASGSEGLWLQIAKKNSGLKSVTYDEALEIALCYGWIDGLKKAYNEKSWIQRFTQRRSRSLWSQINKEKALRLIKEGKMKPLGLEAIENAKANGNWDNAYAPQSEITIPSDFEKYLLANKAAYEFFKTLNNVNRYAILHRIQKAKTDAARNAKIEQFISMLEAHKKLY